MKGENKEQIFRFYYSRPLAFNFNRHSGIELKNTVQKRVQRQSCTRATDSFPMIARALASEAALLCFDELQITDIADTLVLTRLFKELFV